MVKEIQIDVESKQLAVIKKVLKQRIAYKTVWAYGSRVNWTANQYSDLDLVIFEINTVKLGELKEDFAESDLPFTVDIMSWGKIPENFKNKIRKKFVVLQKKPELEGWNNGALSDFADVIMGQSPKGESCNANGNGKPLLNGPTEFGVKSPHPLQFTEDPKKLCKENDILFCVRGSTTGRMNWADQQYAIGRGIAAIRHKEGSSYKHFVRGIIDFNLPGLLVSATGSTFPNISRDQLEDLVVLIPPPHEQKAIASILSSLDDKVDLLHRQNKTLEAIAETLFKQWFVEEEQENWAVECLGNIADINPTYQLKKGEISTYVEMKNVSTSTFNPEGWYKREFASGMKFRNGDTLLARITPCLENGKTCFVTFLDEEEIGWGSTEYIVMRMKEQFHPYISYIIAKDKDFRDFAISSMSGSSGRQRAQASVIKEYDLRVPPLEIIEELNHQLDRILSKLKNNANQIRTLEKLRETLLPRLMSGEVRVEYEN